MIRRASKGERGNAVLEIGLIFLPMMLMILGIFELGRGLWTYHTLTTAVKSGARFSMVHGAGCIQATASCTATVADVATVVRRWGIGLDSGQLVLTLTDGDSTYSCGTLARCLSDTTQWPSSKGNRPGSPLTVQGAYGFRSVLSSFWPGQGSASVNYIASSSQVVEF